MPLVKAKCTNCGANLEVDNLKEAAICPYCQSAYIVEKAINNYSITNNITANQVNIFYSDSEENRLQREYDKIEGFIKIDDIDSAIKTFNELLNTYPGHFDVWFRYLNFLFLCFESGYCIGRTLLKTVGCVEKLCPSERKEEIETKIYAKEEEICKEIQNGKKSVLLLCNIAELEKGVPSLDDIYYSSVAAKEKWGAVLRELKAVGIPFKQLIEYGEDFCERLRNFHIEYDCNTKLFSHVSPFSDGVLFAVGRELILLRLVSSNEVYLKRALTVSSVSIDESYFTMIKDEKRLSELNAELNKVEEEIIKTQEQIDYYSNVKNMNGVLDLLLFKSEKSNYTKALDDLEVERNKIKHLIYNTEKKLGRR